MNTDNAFCIPLLLLSLFSHNFVSFFCFWASLTLCNFQVALKKIADVGSRAENARKVLRELCIMRRLKHPNIVQLHNAFYQPSPTGMILTFKHKWLFSCASGFGSITYAGHVCKHHERAKGLVCRVLSLECLTVYLLVHR